MVPFSVLDFSPIPEGVSVSEALHNTADLAQHAETWGYRRFWLAEHHNMPGIASAATAVIICYVAGLTKMIRVGAGGVMLPNHSPLVIAEQFGTLEALYPGRIDLGVGRAPGTDPPTVVALRRDPQVSADRFPQDVIELMSYFDETEEGKAVRAVPGAGLRVPIWILGSSLFSARLAAMLGLPYAFAAHFAPAPMMQALEIYRRDFNPSGRLSRPYAIVCSCRSWRCGVASRRSCRRRSRTWTGIGQRRNAAWWRARWRYPSSAQPPRCSVGSRRFSA
jgi:luciferase family oxidoreductase group 1